MRREISTRRARFIRGIINDARRHVWNGPGPMVGCAAAVDSSYRDVYRHVANPPTVPPKGGSGSSRAIAGHSS